MAGDRPPHCHNTNLWEDFSEMLKHLCCLGPKAIIAKKEIIQNSAVVHLSEYGCLHLAIFEFKKIYVKKAQNYWRWLTLINYTYVNSQDCF